VDFTLKKKKKKKKIVQDICSPISRASPTARQVRPAPRASKI
jgi:hypothetical protein